MGSPACFLGLFLPVTARVQARDVRIVCPVSPATSSSATRLSERLFRDEFRPRNFQSHWKFSGSKLSQTSDFQFSPQAVASTSTSLVDLPMLELVDSEGKMAIFEPAKASLFAMYDSAKNLQFVGITRDIIESLRVTLGRRPAQCYYVKVLNFSAPSRTALEDMKKKWIEENGSVPPGNSKEEQELWEHGLQLKKLATEAEVAELVEAGADEFAQKRVYRAIGNREEAARVQILKQRGITEPIKFDPMLKEKGTLDVKLSKQPDKTIPGGKK